VIAYRKYLSPSGWNAISGIQAGHKALSADLAADCVIIGAGFAGLAAARRMAEIDPDQRIVLLDADLPGENSSGRNSGFMIHLPYAKISAGRDASRREWQVRLLAHGRQSLEQLIDQHQFRCGWTNSGHYKAAVTAAGVRTLDALRQTLVHHGLSFRCLEAREIAAELGTEHYSAALWLPNCTLLQPAELVHGLVQTLPGNVDPYFDSPVRAIHDEGHWTVETA
jgi:glycine/D-amino acid oxidase-like deaminating enzyme